MKNGKIEPGDIVVVVHPTAVVKVGSLPNVVVIRDQHCPEGKFLIGSYEDVTRAFHAALEQSGIASILHD